YVADFTLPFAFSSSIFATASSYSFCTAHNIFSKFSRRFSSIYTTSPYFLMHTGSRSPGRNLISAFSMSQTSVNVQGNNTVPLYINAKELHFRKLLQPFQKMKRRVKSRLKTHITEDVFIPQD